MQIRNSMLNLKNIQVDTYYRKDFLLKYDLNRIFNAKNALYEKGRMFQIVIGIDIGLGVLIGHSSQRNSKIFSYSL